MSNQVLANQVAQPLRIPDPSRTSKPGKRDLQSALVEPNEIPTEKSSVETTDEKQALEQLDSAVSNLNDFAQTLKRELQFTIDDKSGRTIITVTDPETEEIIRQIPPKEVLRIAESLEEHSGLLLSAQV